MAFLGTTAFEGRTIASNNNNRTPIYFVCQRQARKNGIQTAALYRIYRHKFKCIVGEFVTRHCSGSHFYVFFTILLQFLVLHAKVVVVILQIVVVFAPSGFENTDFVGFS